MMPATRPPFQGDFLGGRLPRAEALGYSVSALRAMQIVQSPGVLLATPRELQVPALHQLWFGFDFFSRIES